MGTLKHLHNWYARLRCRASGFLAQSRGSVLVETALLVPTLLVLVTGGIEVSRFILLDQKIARVASNVTDLTARTESPTSADIDQVFSAIEYIASPFELGDNAVVIISSVSRATGSTSTRVDWQETSGGDGSKTSKIGAPGEVASLPAVLQLREGQALIVGETYYDYRPFFFEGFIAPKTIYHTAFYRPREVAMDLEDQVDDGGGGGGGGAEDEGDDHHGGRRDSSRWRRR
jgi:TadE-like protein